MLWAGEMRKQLKSLQHRGLGTQAGPCCEAMPAGQSLGQGIKQPESSGRTRQRAGADATAVGRKRHYGAGARNGAARDGPRRQALGFLSSIP